MHELHKPFRIHRITLKTIEHIAAQHSLAPAYRAPDNSPNK